MYHHRTQSIDQHIAQEHKLSPFTTYLKEIVYGGNDGIITTFAVVAGFTGSQAGNMGSIPVITVLIFGFANLFADGVSMALGNFLSTRSEQEVYQKEKTKELAELRLHRDAEEMETLELLRIKGFSETQAKTLVEIYKTNEPYWVDFMMNQELRLPNPENENAFLTASATLIAFISFGLIPLLPYLLLGEITNTFVFSCLTTLVALIMLSLVRWKVTARNPLKVLLETLLLGGSAATIAYLVGTLFR